MKRLLNALLYSALLVALPAAAAPAIENPGSTLHDSLPADAIAYLRVVGPGGFSGAPAETPLGEAIAANGNDQLLDQIANGLLAELTQDPKARLDGAWLELIYRLRAPIETALLASPGLPLQAGKLVLRAGIDIESITAMNALLQRLTELDDSLQLQQPLDANGIGLLVAAGSVPVWVQFHPDDSILTLMAGLGADQAAFTTVLASLTGTNSGVDNPARLALEQRIESSAQGPLLWVDVPRMLQGVTAGKPELATAAQTMLLRGVRGAALGWGTRDGKGRLSLVLDAPKQTSLSQMLPTISNDFSLTARGNPGLLAALNLPGPALLKTYEAKLASDPEALQKYQAGKQKVEQQLGLSIEQLIATLGPELLLFSDDSGTLAAVRVGNQQNLETLMQHIAATPDLSYRVRTIGGKQYHHLSFATPSVLDDDAEEAEPDMDPEMAKINKSSMRRAEKHSPLGEYFATLRKRARSNIFWVQDGDWLVFGQIPQVLFDRQRDTNPVVIGDWLRDQQRQNGDHSLLLVSTELQHIPRTLYYAYLGWLDIAASIAGIDYDPFSRPGAVELGLPDSGSYGLQLDLSDPYLGLEFSFEANPLEIALGGGSMGTVAVIGILAAIAVPAYQDYTIRAQVAAEMAQLTVAKTAIAEYYMANGYLPANRAVAGIPAGILPKVDIKDGLITINFSDDAPTQLAGKFISITPYGTGDGNITWRCGYQQLPATLHPLQTESGEPVEYLKPTVEPRHLPTRCRE